MDRSRRSGAFVVLIACLLALGALLPVSARAAEAIGAAVLVSPTGEDPQVAMRTSERVVVVWGETRGVMARYFRLGEEGAEALGPAFRVDRSAAAARSGPRISMDRDGAFVVIWDDGAEVRGQLFAADGTRRGGILILSEANARVRVSHPRVSMAPDGRFVVAWEELGTGALLRYGMFDADGNRSGAIRGVPARVGGGTAALLVDVGAGTESFAVAWNEAQGGGSSGTGMVALFDWNGRLLRRAHRFGGTPVAALSWSNAGPVALVTNPQDSQLSMQRFSPVDGKRIGALRRLTGAYSSNLVAVDSDPRGRLVSLLDFSFHIGAGFRFEHEPSVRLYGPEGKALSPEIFASGLSSMEPLDGGSVAFTRDGTVAVAWEYVYEHEGFGPTGILLSPLRLP